MFYSAGTVGQPHAHLCGAGELHHNKNIFLFNNIIPVHEMLYYILGMQGADAQKRDFQNFRGKK